MAKKMLWAVMFVGAVLIALPFVLGMPSKANAGAKMMDGFRPLMQSANVEKTAAYYNDVFVPLGGVVPAMSQANIDKFNGYVDGINAMGVDAQKLVPALSQALQMPPEQAQQFLATQFPAMSQMLQNLPTMQQDFSGLISLMASNVNIFGQVPAGLQHYAPLVATMQANVDNFNQADSLPPMNLFPWFFVVPGLILVGLSGFGLYKERTTTVSVAVRAGRRSGLHAPA